MNFLSTSYSSLYHNLLVHLTNIYGLIPELERIPGEGKGYLLQYSGLKNSVDCIGHGVAKRLGSGTKLPRFQSQVHI